MTHSPAGTFAPSLPHGQACGPLAATYVVDTNVILVANGQHEAVSAACVQCCQRWLQGIMQAGRVALDDHFEILGEYQHRLHAAGHLGPSAGVGDAFVAWLLHHLDDSARCDQVSLMPDAGRGWQAFPDDPRLQDFDPADRKFVALARTHPESPTILQAADSKWLDWAAPLVDHGVRIQFLCEAEVQRFHRHKFGV